MVSKMLYSRTAKYGIKALVYLTETADDDYKTVDFIAKRTDIPADFLGKIFQELAKRDLLQSQRGRGGGFRPARPGDEISLLEVVKSIDGDDVFDRCLFDTKKCGQGGTCPLHDDWVPIRKQLTSLLAEKTVGDLIEEEA